LILLLLIAINFNLAHQFSVTYFFRREPKTLILILKQQNPPTKQRKKEIYLKMMKLQTIISPQNMNVMIPLIINHSIPRKFLTFLLFLPPILTLTP
jgi:hypothetical protein